MGASGRNWALDALKAIAFVGIVGLHSVAPSGGISTALNVFARIGVPVFFAVSGYYAVGASVSTLWRRTKSVVGLVLLSFGFYSLISLIGIWGEFGNVFFDTLIDSTTVLNLLYYGYVPCAYHLWFLFALTGMYLAFIAYSSITSSYRCLYVAAIVALFFRLTYSEFAGAIDPLGMELRTWMLMGLPAFALGVLIHDKQEVWLRAPRFFYAIGALLGFVLACIECKVFGLQEIYIGTVVSTLCLFVLCLMIGGGTKKGRELAFFGLLGGKTITVAYIVHLAILYWVGLILPALAGPSFSPYATMILTALASLVSGILYERVAKFLRKSTPASGHEKTATSAGGEKA